MLLKCQYEEEESRPCILYATACSEVSGNSYNDKEICNG